MNLFRGTLSSLRWRTRLTLWGAAGMAGLVVVGFAKLADLALATFFHVTEGRPWLPFLLAPSIGMLVVWLTRRFAPGSQGSGIPQVIAATREIALGRDVGTLVSMRIACGKVVFGALALVGGFSAGREGPSVQVAASIMHMAHRYLPHTRALRAQDLILAGGAAGVAAAFNAPLAGIVFAVEELGRRLETRTSGVLMSTIILSGFVAIALMGNYSYFGHLKAVGTQRSLFVPVAFCGILCGVLGGLFSSLLLWPQRVPDFFIWRLRRANPILFAGACGITVALIGWLGNGMSYGSGYAATSQVVLGELSVPWYASVTRYLATLVSYYSGIPGGLFAPSLAVGGALGSTISPLLGLGPDAVPVVVLCMVGFLAAVTQSPITAAIIVMEMIDGHDMVISLMAVALIARAVSSRIGPELYQQLARDFREQPSGQELDPKNPIPSENRISDVGKGR
ncbi:MAG: chloride channel protein [Rugosibacter sp.]|nr:MAG: chloride channel protein [Rugosibacter sp.]TBR08071.1 MAG: chloride channel protein [Rugosibacter sp.]